MTARYVALVVAGVLLTACGTTSSTESASAPAPGKRLVVRGAVVPDDPEPSVSTTKTTKPRLAKASSAPVRADGTETSGGSTTPLASPGASGGGTSSGGGTAAGAGGSGTVADTGVLPEAPSASVTSEPLAPIEPATVSAEPARTPTPSPFAIDFRDMLSTTVAGFPLWLMVVVAIILAGALVFGTGGRRRETSPREEREYEPYAERERERERERDRRYDDDAEPEPA